MEWPEWSTMFIATVDERTIPDPKKISHLKTLLTGKATFAISEMGFSGQFYSAAWNILEKIQNTACNYRCAAPEPTKRTLSEAS